MRAAILPYPGDPFLLNFWLGFFDRIWGKDVDRLYIYLNSPVEKEVVEYIRNLCLRRPKINFTYLPNQIEHGEVINRTLEIVQEDTVMLVEDDCFIFKPGHIDKIFTLIEDGDYDIVGSKRGSCSLEILERAADIWNLDYSGYGDQGCNFWPNLFCAKKSTFLKTSRNFGAKAWSAGEIIPELRNFKTPTNLYSDTFVQASLELRTMIDQSRIGFVPQYHASPNDITHEENKTGIFDGCAPWVHVGSLSSGINGLLKDDKNRVLARKTIDKPEDQITMNNLPTTDQEKQEYERRLAWYLLFVEHAEEGRIEDFRNNYILAIQQCIRIMGLNTKRIHKQKRIYGTLIL